MVEENTLKQRALEKINFVPNNVLKKKRGGVESSKKRSIQHPHPDTSYIRTVCTAMMYILSLHGLYMYYNVSVSNDL